MNKQGRYPGHVYFGITDNPDTWGMCCSKEMAWKCAEEHYDRQCAEERKFFTGLICAVVTMVAVVAAVVLIF